MNILDSMLSTSTQPGSSAPPLVDHRAEAARYALLRRLAPSIRHHLVVNLQPIGMIYEVTERRLRSEHPDLGGLHESVQRINGFTKAALRSCSDVVSWLAPVEGATVSVTDGVRECAGMLATSLSFRGYGFENQVGAMDALVLLPAIRCVLSGALLHVTDHAPPPATVVLTAVDRGEVIDLVLRVEASGEVGHSINTDPDYRRLDWADLQALACAEGAEVVREDGGDVRLMLPRANTLAA